MAVTVDELWARAKTAGFPVGAVVAAERAKGEATALARLRAASRRKGELIEPEPIETQGVVWRVAMVAPSQAIEVAGDLGDLGFRAYCPLGRRVVYRARLAAGKRGRRVDTFPVFGGYVFVGEAGAPVVRGVHPKVVCILGDARGALAVPPAAIAAISAAECEGRWDATRRAKASPFVAGAAVRLVAGPFADFAAVVEAVERSGRIRIAAAVFGQATTIRVEAAQLALVDAA